jgi:hypothetical protein
MTIPAEVIDAIESRQWVVGDTIRVVHAECSAHKDAALSISRVHNGWVFNCFRCEGCAGFLSMETQSPASLVKTIRQHDVPICKVVTAVALPEDSIPFLPDKVNPLIPADAYVWLWKYHLKLQEMAAHQLAWSPSYKRIIVPVHDTILLSGGDVGRRLLGWLGRDVSILSKAERVKLKRPKWLTRKDKEAKHFFYHLLSEDDRLVIVEDVISAIRVHEAAQVNTLALNTTWLPKDVAVQLRPYQVYLWLDGDMYGKKIKYASMCSSFGVKVKVVQTRMDPKEHTTLHILQLLGAGKL